jgi:hypothetical protein
MTKILMLCTVALLGCGDARPSPMPGNDAGPPDAMRPRAWPRQCVYVGPRVESCEVTPDGLAGCVECHNCAVGVCTL